MKACLPLVLLMGIFIAYCGWVRPIAGMQGGAGWSSLRASEAPQALQGESPGSQQSVDKLRHRAEALRERAAGYAGSLHGNDYKLASALFQESARLFKVSHQWAAAADAFLHAGDSFLTVSRYREAMSSYRNALNNAGQDSLLRCSALSRIARTFAITGPLSEADEYSKRAMALCERLPSLKAQAEGAEARGTALYNAAEYAESARLLQNAAEKFAAANDSEAQARALLMLAYCRFEEDRSQGVLLAADALRLSKSASAWSTAAQADVALGTFANISGEWETAGCNYTNARSRFHELGDEGNEAIVLNGTGWVTLKAGDPQVSLQYFIRARKLFRDSRDLIGEGEALAGMGQALKTMERYKELLPLYLERLQLTRKNGNPAPIAGALADLAGFYRHQRRYAEAEAAYSQALTMYRKANHFRGQGTVLIRMAELKSEQGDYSASIALLREARLLKERTGQVEDVAQIQYELSDAYRRLGRLDDALTAIEETIAIIESQRARVAEFDSRAAYFASVHTYYALYIHVLMLLDQQTPNAGFSQRAFFASERSRVRSLLDSLTAADQSSSCSEPQQRQLESARAGTDRVPPRLRANDEYAFTTVRSQAELMDDDTMLLEYALGDEESYLWVIDKKRVGSYILPPAGRIKDLVQDFRNALARDEASGHMYRLHARELSRILLSPVPLAGAKRLLIVPDGCLQYIPFQALSPPGEEGNEAFLVAHHEIVILPSASILGALRQRKPARTPPTREAALFVDPVFEPDDPRVKPLPSKGAFRGSTTPRLKKAGKVRRGESFVRLEDSRLEAEAILPSLGCAKKQHPLGMGCPSGVVVRSGFDANLDYVIRDGLGTFRLLHFATHGVIDIRNPETSALILSLVNEHGKGQNGRLQVGDIYKLKLSADLVVLSACESALGKELASEGTIGLPRAFLYAGAQSVVASLWKVDDEATAYFMARFYSRMHDGETPSSALRHAQLEMARSSEWSKPFHWAAFVLQGEYKITP